MGKGKGYRIGMSKVIAAKYMYDKATNTVSYSDPVYLGEAMTGTFTPNYAEASLHGDDHEVDNSKEMTNVTIALGVTKLPIAAHNVLYGASTSGQKVSEKTTDVANDVGIGFLSRQSDGKYTALIYPKAKFARGAETFNTKGQSVTYSTPTLNGTASGSDRDNEIRSYEEDLSEADALACLTKILGDPDKETQEADNNTQDPEQDDETL